MILISSALSVEVLMPQNCLQALGRSIWQHHWLRLVCPDCVPHPSWSTILDKDVSSNKCSLGKLAVATGRGWKQLCETMENIWFLRCHRLSSFGPWICHQSSTHHVHCRIRTPPMHAMGCWDPLLWPANVVVGRDTGILRVPRQSVRPSSHFPWYLAKKLVSLPSPHIQVCPSLLLYIATCPFNVTLIVLHANKATASQANWYCTTVSHCYLLPWIAMVLYSWICETLGNGVSKLLSTLKFT